MTTELAQKLEGVRDFRKILETVVKELGEFYSADVSQIVLSNPLDHNITSICEYKLYPEANPNEMPVSQSFPLPLEGAGLGAVTLARKTDFHENEINWIRITLAELCDVIRHAQINDVVQRDTFRNTFLFEIQNVMQYSLGIGDALFMVVNILGKVLNVSRCLFICVDDSHRDWKCYEFWQREKVQSCQEYGWPTTDSPIVARSLLATAPLSVNEANQNSYLTPVQEELQLLGVRSLLGVPLRTEEATHGCIILQHCESRHEWTRGEIDMVQNVADTVAEALAKLPDDKRGREPIMRLHQREVMDTTGDAKESIVAIRRALRNSMASTIQSAQKTSAPKPPVPAPSLPQQPAVAKTQEAAPHIDMNPPAPPAVPVAETPAHAAAAPDQAGAPVSEDVMATIGQLANSLMHQASGDISADEVAASMRSILTGMGQPEAADEVQSPQADPSVPALGAASAAAAGGTSSAPHAETTAKSWGDLDSIPTPKTTEQQPAPSAGQWGDLNSIPTPTAGAANAAPPPSTAGESKWGNLDAIGAPGNGAAAGNGGAAADNASWGNLDAIPTPSAGPAKGLSSMLKKAGSAQAAASPLMASLHRDKSKFQQQQVEFVDGGEIQIDDAQAEAKLKQIMQSSANRTSDYIFAIESMDPRMLGRIDGWVSQVEEKDRYATPHAIQVAEYSAAVAKLLGLPAQEVEMVKLAGIVHDVGKMGLPANILQKPEAQLDDNELIWIMKHTIDGSTLLEGFPELAHLAPIVLAHHEDYDGNGYPAGLVGDAIPLAARIIHVASDYHKLISPTRTSPGVAREQAHQTLRSLAGKAYDPAIVEALIACEQQGLVAATR